MSSHSSSDTSVPRATFFTLETTIEDRRPNCYGRDTAGNYQIA